MNHLMYWKIKYLFSKALFVFKKLFYKFSVTRNKTKLSFSVRRSLFKEVFKHLILNICFFAITTFIDVFIFDRFSLHLEINNELLSDILIAMVGIAGVFLGLYCSYISTIFSSKYANCPKEMSSLFENDFITDKSIKSIVNYIIFSIIIIVFNLCNYEIGIVTLIVNLITGMYMIVSYIHIGKRILRMTDTYFVSESLYRNINSYIKRITVPHPFSRDNTLQYNNKNFAQDAIGKLTIINNYNIDSSGNKRISISEFMLKNLFQINYYLEKKPFIPYDSIWFKSEGYKKWYNASDTEISIALNTGTNIGNTEILDKFWFETKVLDINKKCLEKLIENNSIEQVIEYIYSFQMVLATAIKTDNIDYFLEVLKELQEFAINILNNNNNKEINKMSLVESIIALYISLVLDIKKHFDSLDIDIIQNDVIDPNNTGTGFHLYCNNAEIKKLFDGIKVEEKIEEYRITPNWYIQQLVAKYIYMHIIHCCKAIDIVTNEYAISLANELFDKKEYACATLVYSTVLELFNKVQSTLPILENRITKIKTYNKDTENYIWEDYNISNLKNRTTESHNEIPQKWSKCASVFALQNWDNYDSFPDLLGLCYNYTCNYLVQTLVNNDFDSFHNTYIQLWNMVSIYQEISRKELLEIKEPYKQNVVISTLCNPILEFGYISGYAILWSVISGNNNWKELVAANFAKIVQTSKDNSHYLCTQIKIMLNTPELLRPAIYQRSMIHSNWKRRIEKSFCDSEYIKWKTHGFSEIIDTSNPLLKKLIYRKSDFGLISIEAYELFAVFVLNDYLEDSEKYRSRTEWENEL